MQNLLNIFVACFFVGICIFFELVMVDFFQTSLKFPIGDQTHSPRCIQHLDIKRRAGRILPRSPGHPCAMCRRLLQSIAKHQIPWALGPFFSERSWALPGSGHVLHLESGSARRWRTVGCVQVRSRSFSNHQDPQRRRWTMEGPFADKSNSTSFYHRKNELLWRVSHKISVFFHWNVDPFVASGLPLGTQSGKLRRSRPWCFLLAHHVAGKSQHQSTKATIWWVNDWNSHAYHWVSLPSTHFSHLLKSFNESKPLVPCLSP